MEQADPKIFSLIDFSPIRFEPAIGNAENELRPEDAFEIDSVNDFFNAGQDLIREFQLADSKRPTATRFPEPPEEKADHLPKRVQP